MEIVYYISLFVLGAVLGSFYNVVGLRLTAEMSLVKPGSHCFNCKHELKWYELIPVFSYLFLRGRCKSCKERISPKYMIIELLTGLLFMHAYFAWGYSGELIVALTFISLFMIITVSDLEYMIIEDIIVLVFLFLILVERYFVLLPLEFTTFRLHSYIESLIGGLFGFGLLFFISFFGAKAFKKEVMGGGDIKLYGIIGLVLGFRLTFLSLLLAAMLGSVIGIFLIKSKIIKRDTPVPFGPFIAVGSLIAYYYGTGLIHWYEGLFSL